MSRIIPTDREALIDWDAYRQEVINTTSVDRFETPEQKRKRFEHLTTKGNEEEWFAYYFPAYYASAPADFHIEATRRVMDNPEWYEVRNWSREMSKSGRAMMEDLYLTLNDHKWFKLLISSSWENACRLLEPYKIQLETNKRIINDYGKQKKIGSWEAGDFTTRSGKTFRAVGPNNAPRGARSGHRRPDIHDYDDYDTDESVLNEDTVDKQWNFANSAVMMTRSLAVPTLVRWNGNVIAEKCCIVYAQEHADYVSTVNLTDENGKINWEARINEKIIARLEQTLSPEAFQRECYNNPHVNGKTFKEIKWGACPPLEEMPFVVSYSDPATSNKDISEIKNGKQNSCKATALMGRKGFDYFVYKIWVHNMSNEQFINTMYEAVQWVGGRTIVFSHIENNTLQDPIFQQILRPLIYERSKAYGTLLSLTPDDRKKGHKFFRIEATLAGINKNGHLIFNQDEMNDPHMKRAVAQFKSVSPKSKTMDAPDAVQGCKIILDEKYTMLEEDSIYYESHSSSKRY